MSSTFLPEDQVESVSKTDHRTLVVALEHSFKQFESDVAIDTPDCKLTYAELDVLTSQVAAKLQSSCLLYTSPSPRDQRGSRMPSSA